MSSRKYSQKDYESDQKKLLKIKSGLEKHLENNPKLKELINNKDPKLEIKEKLKAIDLTIAYLVRKGNNPELSIVKEKFHPLQTLIDIANDYEKKLEDNTIE